MKEKLRRSGVKIAAGLAALLGSLSFVMVAAVVNGALGFFAAMGVTVFASLGVAKALGEAVALSYGAIAAAAVACGVLRGVLRYFEQYGNHYIAFKLLAVLRDRIFSALRLLAPAKTEGRQKGNLIAMITSDIETLEVFYAHTVSPICIAAVVSVSVFLFVGLAASWYLALTALIGYVVIGIASPLRASAKLKAGGVNYRRGFASFNAFFLDSIKGIREIVLNNCGEERKKEVNRRSEDLLKETEKMKNSVAKNSAAVELLISLFIIASFAVGALLVSEGTLSLGRMIIGVTAVFGSFGPVTALSALPGNLTQTFACGDRVLNLLEEQPAVQPVIGGKTFRFDRVNVDRLSFAYNDEAEILKEICLNAKKGEIIGIVGKSGCGKSTLLKLLMRFREKNSGRIDYNETEISEIDSVNLTDNVTMVPQNVWLFDETVEENLRIAKPEATAEELEAACRAAAIHERIVSLPDGYRTRVGFGGSRLSAGEKQRLGVARAFLRGSGLILLDEPTGNIDSLNEGILLKSLVNAKKDKCIILVSHRESTMSIADRIYRLENHRLHEGGENG